MKKLRGTSFAEAWWCAMAAEAAAIVVREEEELAGGSRVCRCSGEDGGGARSCWTREEDGVVVRGAEKVRCGVATVSGEFQWWPARRWRRRLP